MTQSIGYFSSMASASSPPLKQRTSTSCEIRALSAKSFRCATIGSKIGKCLLSAGPKLSEALTRLFNAA